MCCFYWLMNKAVLAYGRAEYSQAERDREKEREQAESERHHVAPEGERCSEPLPVSHNLVATHRLIEMGQFKM